MPGPEETWSIGELAQEAATTHRTLHHYDDIGLLVPAHRTAGGYRRYTGAEVARLRRIQTLRSLGLALQDVRRVLDGDEPALLERVLEDHLRRTDERLEAERSRRERIRDAVETVRLPDGRTRVEVVDALERVTSLQAGAQKVVAILSYHDLQAAHAFLVDVFALRPGDVQHDGDGAPVHGEVRAADGSVVWLHPVAAEHGLTSPREVDLATGGVLILVEDVDAHFRHAERSGARIDYPPVDQPYGLREYGARDPEGGRWYFAQESGDGR